MSSTLSPLAIYQILSFTEQDYRLRLPKLRYEVRVPQVGRMARRVSPKWAVIYELYLSDECTRSLDDLRSPKLFLHLKDDLVGEDMRIFFGHAEPMAFDEDFPTRIVSKVVQAFVRLEEEPSALDFTVNLPPTPPPEEGGLYSGFQLSNGIWVPIPREPELKSLAELWPDAYASHLPCAECTKVESLGNNIPRNRRYRLIEKFHVSSKHFDKKLTVEFSFVLGAPAKYEDSDFPVRPPKARKTEKLELRQVRMYLDGKCGHGRLPCANTRKSELMPKLKNRLPKHHLMCEFEDEKTKAGYAYTGAYQLILHHFRRDLSYCDMLTALVADHNCTMDRLRMGALDGQLTDYRSVDVVFGGGLRLNALSLAISSHSLARLIKTADFLRLPTIEALSELKFLDVNTTVGRRLKHKSWTRREKAILGSPLWFAGMHLLRNCSLYEVHCDGSKHHLESIALKLVQLCEKFERGENVKIRERFEFKAPRHVDFPFNEGNQVSGSERIGCGGPRAGRRRLKLYRFQNAATGKWLSAIVAQKYCDNGSATSILLITTVKAFRQEMSTIDT